MNVACNFDGTDCEPCVHAGCPLGWKGDGMCDPECNNLVCEYDGGDCKEDCAEGCTREMLNDGMC